MAQALSIAWHERGLKPRVASVAVAAMAALVGIELAYSSPAPSVTRTFAGIAIAGVAVWMVTSAKTHVTLAVLMVYLACIDGVIKLESNSSAATLGRDALLYAIVIGIVLKRSVRKESFQAPPLTGWIIAFVAVVAAQIFNPQDISLSHSLASTRPELEFVPLFFLGYSIMRSPRRIKAFLMILIAVAALNGAVSLVQFGESPSQLASWGPGYAARVNGTGGVSARGFVDSAGKAATRPFGLGSDIGFGGIVGLIAAPAAFALLSLGGNTRLKIATGLLSVGVVLAVFTSQQRTAIVGTVVAIIAFILLATSSRRVVRLVVGLAVGLAIGYVAVSALTANTNSSLFSRYSSISPANVLSTSVDYRSGTFSQALPHYLTHYPLGAGIGKVGPAGNSAGGPGYSGLDAESEPTYLVLDIGIPGLLVLLGFQLRLIIMSLRVRRLKDLEMRLLLAALAAPLFALFIAGWVGVTTATTPGSPYLWFVGGVLTYWLISARTRSGDADHRV